MKTVEFKDLVGKTLIKCTGKKHDSEIIFKTDDGKTYKIYHAQNCCESVTVDDICGDLSDLIGSPIIQAEESSFQKFNSQGIPVPEYRDSFTWTFYRIATAKGQCVIRWYGESNGCYSESVDFCEVEVDN